jgi:hypothetical protein
MHKHSAALVASRCASAASQHHSATSAGGSIAAKQTGSASNTFNGITS